MESKGPKKPHRYKKHKSKAQERLLKKFPYRLRWLTEPNPNPASTQSWKAKSIPLKDQLPLQKKLVPTRSIPLPRAGAPDYTSPISSYSQPPHPPLYKHWELKLLSLRFPKQDLGKLLPPKARANQPYTSETSASLDNFP